MFIAALFIIARTWKQSCPSADEWIRKLWYIYTMKYYSAIKRNDSGSPELRWTNLDPVIQSKSERENKISYINTYIGEGNGTPTLVLLPGKSHGWRSLVGCSPWGC